MFVELPFQWSILGKVLQATDRRKVTFLDVLIECDQKTVVANAAVVSSPSLTSFLSFFSRSSHILMNFGRVAYPGLGTVSK